MDLNEFIFRDDATETLGAGAEFDDDFTATEESPASVTPEKVGLAVIGSAVIGLSNLLGHVKKGH
jgi:hypothetical protein